MELGLSPGKMARDMKVNIWMIRSKGKECLHGLMGGSMMGNGREGGSMERVFTIHQRE